MHAETTSTVQQLLARGVRMPHPASVFVGPEVAPERIAPGVTIHPGCRLRGAGTSIGPGSSLGAEGPATVEDSQLGAGVRFKGGFCSGATLLDGVELGANAHVRPGCLLEEQSSGGHAVGLKQTVLLPFVTLGSLVNFCDCLMAGGRGRRDHSEVGSSYIHFNFTPHQDKATASLIGDVPRGVMLDQPPIFLGGQGGLVGPASIAFGTVIAAGTVFRGDVTAPGRLVFGHAGRTRGHAAYDARLYGDVSTVVAKNLAYIGNLFALREWYRTVRAALCPADPGARACHAGAVDRIGECLAERAKRLGDLADRVLQSLEISVHERGGDPDSPRHAAQRRFVAACPGLVARLGPDATFPGDARRRDLFLAAMEETAPSAAGYVAAIQSLPETARASGRAWLQSIVDAVLAVASPA